MLFRPSIRLVLACSHSSPAPDSIRSTTMFMSSYNYPHFENEESDVLSDQDPTKIPWAGDQCGKILIHSTPNVKWGEESFHRGDRALLETVKGWEGGGGWEASFIHFSGIHQPDRWTRILTLELSLAGNIRNTGLYHFWLIKESCKLKKKKNRAMSWKETHLQNFLSFC